MATHFSKLVGYIRTGTDNPSNPSDGEFYFNTETNYLMIYIESQWVGIPFMPV